MNTFPKTPGTGGKNVTFGRGQTALYTPEKSYTSAHGTPASRNSGLSMRLQSFDQRHSNRKGNKSGMQPDSGVRTPGQQIGESGDVRGDMDQLSESALMYGSYAVSDSRGAGSGPGLASGFRGDAMSQSGYLRSAGMQSRLAFSPNAANLTASQLGPMSPALQPHHFLSDDSLPMAHALAPAKPSDAPADGNWVTVFGFPQGYQDGVLKHLRDRGEVVEWRYSGTNYVAVRFKCPRAVAEAVGLNGSVLPADGMPGDNFMIGVKRGQELAQQYAAGRADEYSDAASRTRKIAEEATRPGGGLGRSVGRFLAELLDITDLSPSD